MKQRSVLFVLLVVVALAATALVALAGPVTVTGPAAGPQQQVPTVAAPTRAAAGQTPADDLKNVLAAKKLRMGTSLDNPPFSYYREDNTPNGFDVALGDRVSRKLGVQSGFVDFAFEGLLDALQLGQVDAAIAAISLTPERAALVDFSNPYYVGEDGWLAATASNLEVKSPEDLAKLRVGVQSGSVYQTFLKEILVDTGEMLPQNLMAFVRPEDMVRGLASGDLDVAVLDRQPAETFAKQGDVKLVGHGLYPQVYSIAVRKGSSLLPEINKALVALRADGTIKELAKTYLDVPGGDITIPTPTPMPTPAVTPTPPPCIDGMSYVADLNYDDKNMKSPPVMKKGQAFTKTWRIRNSGTCDWPADYELTYVRGNTPAARMGGQETKIGKVVAPGQTVDVSVALVAPQAYGVYQAFWQMMDTEGGHFGETVWVGIQVPAPPTPTPLPPPPGATFTVDRTTINQGECVTFRWNVQNVKAVYFYQQGQPWQNGGVGGNDSRTVCPAATTIYTLRTVSNSDVVQEQSIQINVNPSANAPQIVTFASSPEFETVVGQCVNFWWDIRGTVNRVALVRDGAPVMDYGPVQGSRQDCPPGPGTSHYELQAFGVNNVVVKAQRNINVKPGQPPTPVPPPPVGQPEIRRLSATESTPTGSCIWVSWEFGANVAYARLFKNGQLYGDNAQSYSNISSFSGNANGDCDTANAGAYTYRLEAFNSAGQTVSKEATTQVYPAPMPR